MVLRWIAAGMGETRRQSAASTATCTSRRCAAPDATIAGTPSNDDTERE